jgi:PAS domain S-box-containing protein
MRTTIALRTAVEATLPILLEAAPDAMIIVDHGGRIQLLNGQAETLFGYSREELVGQPVEALIPERFRDDHAKHRSAYFAEPVARSMAVGMELHGRRKDGSAFPAEISLAPVTTPDGQFVIAAVRDTTERKRVEAKFKALLKAAPDPMVIVDGQGLMVVVNTQTEKVFGYTRAELHGKPVEMLIPERFRGGHERHRSGYFADPRVRAMGSGLELYGLRKDGTEFPVEISLSPFQSEEGVLVSSTIRDVTERKKTDELRFRLAAIVDSSDDAIVGNTLDGVITSWNKGAERIFGYTADEIVGMRTSMLVPSGNAGDEAQLTEQLRRGELAQPFEIVCRRKDGRDIDVAVTASLVRDSRGDVVGAAKVARDISEQKRAARALARAKDAADKANRELEAFSYSVAHDLRAPLRGIDGFSKLLIDEYAERLDAEGLHYLARVRESAQSMAHLIEDLLNLARVSKADVRDEFVNLSSLARAIMQRLQSTQPERRVDVAIEENVTIGGDGRLLGVVLDNLLANAWKFTRNQPQARIEFGTAREADERIFFVRDNGAGFDMAYTDKLFGVFQRLHGDAEFEGTGIGLATVQRIVHRHGGRVWADGRVGEGAAFYFTLGTPSTDAR